MSQQKKKSSGITNSVHLGRATAVWDVGAVNEPSQTWDVLNGNHSLSLKARVLGTLLVSLAPRSDVSAEGQWVGLGEELSC